MPNKLLGQHFLHCRWVISTMTHAAEIEKSDTVLEIGPGTGILTRALAHRAGHVIAVEKDEKLATQLQDAFKKEKIINAEIIPGDALKLLKSDFKNLSRFNLDRFKVVANIPYYLTSRLIRLLLENEPRPERIVLTIQKEVAQRIVARPPHMNLLALSVQALGKPKIIKAVPANCFSPKPKVDSAVINITEISDRFFLKNGIKKEMFFTTLKKAFAHKRKLLTSAFPKKTIYSIEGLSKTARAEELTLAEWATLVLRLPS